MYSKEKAAEAESESCFELKHKAGWFFGSASQCFWEARNSLPQYAYRLMAARSWDWGLIRRSLGSSYSSFGSSILILIFYMVMMREGVEPGCCGVSEE